VEISQVHSLSGSRLATISEERIKAGTKKVPAMNYFQQESLAFVSCSLLSSFLLQPFAQEHSLGIFGMLLGLGIKGYLQFCLFKEVWYFFSTVKLFRISRVRRKGR